MHDQTPKPAQLLAPPAPNSEQMAFVDDPSPLVMIKGPPRSGKTTALWLRSVLLKKPVLWAGLWREAGGLPRGSRAATIGRLISELYLRRHGGLTCDGMRQINLVELKRIFLEVNAESLPGFPDLWFQAYLAVKKSRLDNRPVGVNAVLTRLDLKVENANTREMLLQAIERTDMATRQAGMIWPHDLMEVFERAIVNRPELIREALGSLEVLCVEDVQTLTSVESRLLLAFAKTGIQIWASLGQYQCINLRDGGTALAYERRLISAGFSVTNLTTAQGLSIRQARIICDGLGVDRIYPFRGVGNGEFKVEFMVHEGTENVIDDIAARLRFKIDGGERPSTMAVLVPLAEMTNFVAQKLMAAGVPAMEHGRASGENSAGFAVCMAIVKAIIDPRDVVAMRQVGYLWVEDSSSYERALRAAVSRSLDIVDAASAYGIEESVEQMVEWLERIRQEGAAGIADAVREAPLWPGDPTNEGGLTRFMDMVRMTRTETDWGSPAWQTLAALAAESVDDRTPDPDKVQVMSVADTKGFQWKTVEVVGYSQGLMPGPCLRSEESLETHVLAQALSRASKTVVLHHVKKLKFSERMPEVSLKPSSYNLRMGITQAVPEQDMNNPKFKPREKFHH